MMKSYFDKRKRVTDYLKIPNLSSKFQLNQDEHVVHNIISETSKEHLVDEIKHLRNIDGKLLFANGDYEIYFANADEIPFVMREIGRQRELTFREVGEGTNMPFDRMNTTNITTTYSFGIKVKKTCRCLSYGTRSRGNEEVWYKRILYQLTFRF